MEGLAINYDDAAATGLEGGDYHHREGGRRRKGAGGVLGDDGEDGRRRPKLPSGLVIIDIDDYLPEMDDEVRCSNDEKEWRSWMGLLRCTCYCCCCLLRRKLSA